MSKALTETLKANGEDFEWYPTTETMIEVVKRWIPENADSIMDIGAGDGRVLESFAKKCEFAKLYGIEKSEILIQAQDQSIIPIGTEFYEQNLASLPVDYLFCNPPYSHFEEWVCKIINEAFAKKAYLVIPQRWKESKLIEKALKLRDATARVIHTDDFIHGERAARAVIDIIEITFSTGDGYYERVKDPFDIWFDQNIDTFDQAAEFEESATGDDLARMYANSNIDEMVQAYRAEYDRLEQNYRSIFELDLQILKELGVDKNHVREGLKKKIAGLKVKYWKLLFTRLDAITSRLTTKSSGKLLDKLTANTSVEFTATNAYAVVLWAIKNANQYFDIQIVDLFYELATFDGVSNYKSNQRTWEKDGWRYNAQNDKHTHFTLDYRIIVSEWRAIFDEEYGRYEYPGNLAKNCHHVIADIIAVLSNLGFTTNSPNSYSREWVGGKWQNFYETKSGEILFQVKAYKNGNLHMRFLPLAIRALNIEVGRLLKWVRSEEEVVEEMGYTPEEAARYFNHNVKILPSHLKVLALPDPDLKVTDETHPESIKVEFDECKAEQAQLF